MAVVELPGRVMASDLHLIVDMPPAGGPAAQLDGQLREVGRTWITSNGAGVGSSRPVTSAGSTASARQAASISVDGSTLSLLASMVEGYECTAGLFDPSVLRALIAEGYGDKSASTLAP